MVGADILAEIRLRADGLRARVDWGKLSMVLAMAMAASFALMRWPSALTEEEGSVLTTALVGAAVWGAP